MRPDPQDVALASRYARLYAARGFNVLPAATDAKKPLVRFADLWETPVPPGLIDRFPTSNLMVMTGRHWRLLVIDLDGPEARQRWAGMGPMPARTWVTHSGGDGQHVWLLVPPDYPEPLPAACLWEGQGKHSRIDRLCDRSLVTAPPSIHVETGRRYRFLDKAHSPIWCPMPAPCPGWVLGLQPVVSKPVIHARPAAATRRRVAGPAPRHADRDEVLAAVVDKVGILRDLGVQFVGRPRANGWWSCHGVFREDRHPSAAVNVESGVYVDSGDGTRMSFFDLVAELRGYRSWMEAKDELAERVMLA